MNAKKLTMAVSLMMVLAAAFVLVVPSESDDAATFEITEAKFTENTSGVSIRVAFSETFSNGNVSLYFGSKVIFEKAPVSPGSTYFKMPLGKTIEEGTYLAVVTSEKGTAQKEIVWPTPVENEIKVINPAVGGTITASKAAAFPGETITVSYTKDDNYALVALYMNGLDITDELSFTMPNQKAVVSGEFKKVVVMHTVTFMVSTMEYDVQEVLEGATVTEPAVPEVKGVIFAGWCTADDKVFDLKMPITEDVVLYASYAAEAPSEDQTTKFVANIAVEEDACKLVTTAYDGKIIGKGTATIGVYMMYGGNFVYIDAVKYAIDGKDVFSVDNITKEIKTIATEPGQYAVMSTVTLDSGASYITNFALFEIEAQA